MEKRLLLAAVLSFLVVYFWSSAINPQQSSNPHLFDTITNQELNTSKGIISDDQTVLDQSESFQESGVVSFEKISNVVDNSKLSVTFSNLGGVIEKVNLKEYHEDLPIQNFLAIKGFEDIPFALLSQDDDQITYFYETEKLKIYKHFYLTKDDYIIKSNIRLENKTEMSKKITLDIYSYEIDMSSMDNENLKKDATSVRSRSLLEYVGSADKKMHRKNNAFKFKSKELKKVDGNVDWTGFRTRYFCFFAKPLYDTAGYVIDPVGENKLNVQIISKELVLSPLESKDFEYVLFSGPEKLELLKSYDFGFELIKKYYKNGLLDGMAKLMNAILHLIYKIIPNWGVCIILMSIIVYFSMYPLTIRGMLSMRKMQSLQPEILKIKEKYKNDQQRSNLEVMELYKKYKINPLGGCLPMLLQMPVFIGLYQVLWRSVYFNGASFLWIKDLSQPDHLFKLPITLPIVNSEYLNILPVLMMIIMFFQQKLSAKNMVLSDPAQQSQQKMMSIIMPLFLGFIFYTFASGLTLYFTMFYLFSSFTQWKMSQQGKGK